MKTIIDVIPQLKTGTGFFSKFVAPVWATDYPNPAQLDIFYGMTYGDKWTTPLLDHFIDEDTGTISDEDLGVLASMMYSIRGLEWSRMYAALKAEYNPVENTTVDEEVRENRAIAGANGNTRTLNTSTSNTGNATVQSTATGSGSTATNRFGFDSSTAVGDTTGSDSSNTSSTTGTQSANTIADTGTITDAGTNSSSDSFQRIYKKHGNIGIMTAAQLIGGDIELWQWTFIIQVMEDINKYVSLSVY